MSRWVIVLVCGALIAGWVGAASAEPAPANSSERRPAPTASATSDTLSPPPPQPETPMAAEVRQARESFASELSRLTTEYRAAKTAADALAIQRRIAELKFNDELRVLDIQARYARAAGLAAYADQIETMIAKLRAEGPDASRPATAK